VDADEVRKLIDFISKSKFVEFEMEREGFRLRLVKGNPYVPAAVQVAAGPVASVADAATPAVASPAETPAPASPEPEETGQVNLLRSPIVGTFYRSPSPNSPPFVEIGDRVRKGQTLCIIEAMKVMNEIESEHDGEILEIGVANGQPVEYGEILFRLVPLPSAG
jgi:acetyl-CoA carboxylase biotin carboxyl carrier protein